MKKVVVTGFFLVLGIVFLPACKKNKCAECHYDADANTEVELGQKCGDELKNLEANGYSDGTNTYTVHCGEGH